MGISDKAIHKLDVLLWVAKQWRE